MAGGRWRRAVRTPGTSLLPVQRARRHQSNTVSCWYCDFKVTRFNDCIFTLGRKHARFFQGWFTIGVGFSFLVSVGATLLLLWELVCAAQFFNQSTRFGNVSLNWLFGVTKFSSFSFSLLDAGIMVYSTVASIIIHELGHAFAASSQGIHVEYAAIFLAIVFPGAFVALNYDLLQSSPMLNTLRVYCAGIWHNAVLCAVCWLMLLVLPSVLHPLYMHEQNPMVLSVDKKSPLSSYLSQGDVIVSLDGKYIRSPQELIEKLETNTKIPEETYDFTGSRSNETVINGKGYCIPNSWLEQKKFPVPHDDLFCPDELVAFISLPCSTSILIDKNGSEATKNSNDKHCLNAKDIVKLKKCGDGWETSANAGICACSEDESCMTPVQSPETTWIEFSISRSYSTDCLKYGQSRSSDNKNSTLESSTCGGAFVFVGNPTSVAKSLKLSAYRPWWASGSIVFWLPAFLEKVLYYTLHVSASLALFNSLPAFFLDGESILEACLICIPSLRPASRRRVLRIILCVGTVLLIFSASRITLTIFNRPAWFSL